MELPFPGLILREDGTLDRSYYDTSCPFVPASEHERFEGVATRDVVLDQALGTWVRVFLPQQQQQQQQPEQEQQQQEEQDRKLPIILYFHGSGFLILSPGCKPFHELCCQIASRLQVIVVSASYRLAPEHRLPAAFEDAWASLQWLLQGGGAGEPWLRDHGNLTSCFLMGHSAGGTIVSRLAHQARTAGMSGVRGVICCIPGLSGEEVTASELRLAKRDEILSLECLHTIWKLALPENSSFGHPFVAPSGLDWGELPPVLLVVGDCDLMVDRQLEFGRFLESVGTSVTTVICKGFTHSEMRWPELHREKDEQYARLGGFIRANLG